MNQKNGILLVLATAIISGFSIFINKFSVAKIDPSVFTFLKNALVALFLLSLVLAAKEIKTLRTLTKKQWLQLIGIGFIGGSIPFLLFFKGLSLTTAAVGAFIHKTLFIYASLFALFFLKEKLNKKLIIAAALLLVGNFLLLKLNAFTFDTGALLVLIATVFWAAENTLSKHVLRELPSTIVAFGRMFFGSLFILLFLTFTGKVPIIGGLSANDVVWTFVTAALLLLFVLTYYSGLKYIKVSTATSILLLGSPITTLLSFTFLDATVAVIQFIGILFIVTGISITLYFVEFSKSFPRRSRSES